MELIPLEDYEEQVKKLKPRGTAWESEDTDLDKTIEALASAFHRIEGRANDLIIELDPRTATEMLTDWERLLGLPDECSDGLSETLQQRRLDAHAAYTARGGATVLYMEETALAAGFDVDINDDTGPFRAGDPVGLPVFGEEWAYVFIVSYDGGQIIFELVVISFIWRDSCLNQHAFNLALKHI